MSSSPLLFSTWPSNSLTIPATNDLKRSKLKMMRSGSLMFVFMPMELTTSMSTKLPNTRVGHIAAEFERLANVLLGRSCGNPALITYPRCEILQKVVTPCCCPVRLQARVRRPFVTEAAHSGSMLHLKRDARRREPGASNLQGA
jgi:hypothetical protein